MFINLQPISNVLGVILILFSITMLTCVPVSLFYGDGAHTSFLWSALITFILGALSWLYKFKSSASINKREGYLIVVTAWLCTAFAGALPYVFDPTITSSVDAIFESFSGITTTGATILTDIESTSPSILLWRSITQWLGGMGIIVLTVAIFPLLGIGGIELFVAESPGPTSDRIHPRIKDTARTLWLIYFVLTIILIILLKLEGMSFFDAVNHAFTTISSGGYSTKSASVGYFTSPMIQYTIIFFMILSGTNFTILYYASRARWSKVYMNEEWRMYMIIIVLFLIFGTTILVINQNEGFEASFRKILFNGVSIITTTGYSTDDYLQWGPALYMAFFFLLFSGACAGSTSGGFKLVRHLALMRNGLLEFKRVLHPRALIRLKINQELVAPRIMTHILVFMIVYLFLFTLGSVLIAGSGVDFVTSIGASAASIGNVGPGIGEVGPRDTFVHLPDIAKMTCCFLMLCGRLELITVIILFTPYFWKDN